MMRLQRFLAILVVFGLVLAGNALPLRASDASLLRDINTAGVVVPSGAVSGLLSLGQAALVPVVDPVSGTEIWVTDGTDIGTRPLLDICRGDCSTRTELLGAIGRVGVFQVTSEESQLWRSDGTSPGTFLLTRVSQGGPESCGFQDSKRAVAAGSTLFFSGRTQGGCELWKTDGTVAGTQRLREITISDSSGPVLHDLTAVGNRVFFVAQNAAGWGLWRSDGTTAGTIRLHGWTASQKPGLLVAAGSRLYFVAEKQGREVWTSDGTPAGTKALTNFAPADPALSLQQTGGSLYFLANDGTNGREMWASDGTAAGTRPVTRFTQANPFPVSLKVEKLGGRLVFPANDGSGTRFWTSNGQPGSTAPLSGCAGGCPQLSPVFEMVRAGAKIFFSAAGAPGCTEPVSPPTSDLWVSDGTGAGTRRAHDACPCCQVTGLSPLLGKVFYSAGNPLFGTNVWGSDGTVQGTGELISTNTIAGLPPLAAPPVAVNGRALLAPTGLTQELPDLWVSDGTRAGTEALAFIGRNGLGSFPQNYVPTPEGVRFIARNGEQVFQVWDSRGTPETTEPLAFDLPGRLEALGPLTLGWGPLGLWRTDGTAAGTFRISPEDGSIYDLVVVGNRAVFLLSNSGVLSLWTADGTLAGTQKLLDLLGLALLLPGSTVTLVTDAAGRHWLTDGTLAGTRQIPMPDEFDGIAGLETAQLGSALYFQGATVQRDEELWRTDGTAAGTHPFAGELAQEPSALITHQGALYFFAKARNGADFSSGLWRSDGTEAGTVLLRSFPRIALSRLTSLGSTLFFTAREDDQGVELWRTDGTPAGTRLVRDISPGELSSDPSDLTPLGGKLYFAAHGEEHGIELWESDGTAAGTRIVQDISPGALSSAPLELTAGGDGRLYFAADDAIHGYEPWVYAPGGAACVPSDTVLCLRGGRFKVEADWRASGGSGRGRAVSLTPDTGYFWFFDSANVEVILKVLDGQGLNGHHWVFYGALSNVEYSLTVTDTQTGAARRYTNVPGRLASVADTRAFGPLGAHAPGVMTTGPASSEQAPEAIIASRTTAATGSCTASATRLCLRGGRFAVEASWKAQGQMGTGKAVLLPGGDTGYFWFFDANNVEVVLKVLDGTAVNGKFWVFYGALSDVEYTLTVTDTETGAVKTYTNPAGRLASVADTEAF